MSIKRKIFKFILILIGIVIALPTVLVILTQVPSIQTYAARKATQILSESIDGEIKVEKVFVSLPNKVVLKDLSITSPTPKGNNDTLLNCNTLYLSIKPAELLKGNIGIGRVILEDGNFNLVTEAEGMTNIKRIFGSGNDNKEKKENHLKFSADEVRLKNFGFDLINSKIIDRVNSRDPQRADIVNFSDLDVSDINITIKDVIFQEDSLSAYVKQISCRDRSGFTLETLSGNFSMHNDKAVLTNMTLSDGYSIIMSDYLCFDFSQEGSGDDFLNKVIITLDMKNTVFDFQTIGKITPSLKDCHLKLLLNGRVSGPIADLRTKGLIVNTDSGTGHLNINAKVQGLPETDQTILIADINESTLTSADIAHIIAEFGNGIPSPFIMGITPATPYHLDASISGLLLDFGVKAEIRSVYGSIYPDMRLDISDTRNKGVTISGNISTKKLNSGIYAGTPLIGDLNMKSSLYMNFKDGDMDIRADKLDIGSLEFNGYTLSDINISGFFAGNSAEVQLYSQDQAMHLQIDGSADFKSKDSTSLKMSLAIDALDLARLGLNKKDNTSVIQGNVNLNVHSNSRFDVFGDIEIDDLYYTNDDMMYSFENISYRSIKSGSTYDIELLSPFTDIRYEASAPLSSLYHKIGKEYLHEALPSLFGKAEGKSQTGNYSLSVNINKTADLFDILKIPAKISKGTSIGIQIDSTDNMQGTLYSDSLSFGNYGMKHLSGEIRRDSTLSARLLSSNINAGGFNMQNGKIYVSAQNDSLRVTYSFENQDGETVTSSADIAVDGNIIRRQQNASLGIGIRFDDSDIFFNHRKWIIPQSAILFSGDSISIDNFTVKNKNQSLKLNGTLSKKPEDSLFLSMNKFDISIANVFMSKPLDLTGYFSGKAIVSEMKDIPNILLDIRGDSLSFYSHELGSIYVNSEWNKELEVLDISLLNTHEKKNRLNINGYFSPDEKYLNLNSRIDSLDIALIEPFTEGLFSDVSGSISTLVDIEYSKENGFNIISSDSYLNNLGLTVDFIKVPYRINGPFHIDNTEIYVDDAVISDRFGHTGTVKGGIRHDRLKDIRLDTRIDFRNLHCMDTKERDNSSFYGNVFATGKIDIKGPMNDILLDIAATTEENTAFHVPLSSSSTASSSGLLTFINKKDKILRKYDINSKTNKNGKEKSSNLAINLDINANPNAEVMIEINKSTGDILKSTGQGNIKINIDPSENVFDMFGDYTIDQGSYKFTILGITSKDFILQQGGQINFDGDIMDSRLNASALYKTKASINTLTADTSSVSSRRTVDCYINLSGTLAKPDIGFDIKIQDLDPTTKSKIDGILSSDDKVQKQFVSLLISGSFLPDEQSGIVNNSTLLYANVSEMLSSQLNNVFRQLDIPLDLGLNYQPGEANSKGGDIFDVAISTQLFNNRVIVNGNIGNGQYDKANSVVGDIDIEIKLNKSGNLRLNIFSHSADQYSNYLDDSQRQGIGIIYQDEFNNFKELFRKIFWSKKKREEYAKKQMELFMKNQNIDNTIKP